MDSMGRMWLARFPGYSNVKKCSRRHVHYVWKDRRKEIPAGFNQLVLQFSLAVAMVVSVIKHLKFRIGFALVFLTVSAAMGGNARGQRVEAKFMIKNCFGHNSSAIQLQNTSE